MVNYWWVQTEFQYDSRLFHDVLLSDHVLVLSHCRLRPVFGIRESITFKSTYGTSNVVCGAVESVAYFGKDGTFVLVFEASVRLLEVSLFTCVFLLLHSSNHTL